MNYREKNLTSSIEHLGASAYNDVVVNLRDQNSATVFVMDNHNELIDITIQNIDHRMYVWVGGKQYKIREGQVEAVDDIQMPESEYVNL